MTDAEVLMEAWDDYADWELALLQVQYAGNYDKERVHFMEWWRTNLMYRMR